MKNAEINKLGANELTKLIQEEAEKLDRLKLAHAISPIENPMRIPQSRRLIARLKTALNAQKNA